MLDRRQTELDVCSTTEQLHGYIDTDDDALCPLLLLFSFIALLFTTNSYFLRRCPRSSLHSTTSLPAQKFDPSTFVKVTIKKPLGLELVEAVENKPRGVMVAGVGEGSNAKLSGKQLKGLFLVSANDIDCKTKSFDEVIDVFQSNPKDAIDLVFVSPNDVFKGAAMVKVMGPEGQSTLIKALKGQNLRTVLQQSNIEVYGGSQKLTNCGGGASCGTCVVNVNDNNDWEIRPDLEAKRLKKYSESCRLSCNTIIEGDCTVTVQPPKV